MGVARRRWSAANGARLQRHCQGGQLCFPAEDGGVGAAAGDGAPAGAGDIDGIAGGGIGEPSAMMGGEKNSVPNTAKPIKLKFKNTGASAGMAKES